MDNHEPFSPKVPHVPSLPTIALVVVKIRPCPNSTYYYFKIYWK